MTNDLPDFSTMKMSPELLAMVKRTLPNKMAEELLSVQPMSNLNFDDLAESLAAIQMAHGANCSCGIPHPVSEEETD